MPDKRFSINDEQEICRLYLAEKQSCEKIAKSMGCSPSLISRTLKKYQVKIRTISESRRSLTKEQELSICKDYQQGCSACDLAKIYKRSVTTISGVLNRNDVTRHYGQQASRRLLSSEEEMLVAKSYEEGKNTYELAKLFNCSYSTILNTLERVGISRRPKGVSQRQLTPLEEEEVSRLYLNRSSTPEIAKAFGVTRATINRILKRNNVELRSAGESKRSPFGSQEDKACHLYEQGCSFSEICELFECSAYAIRSALRRKKIPRRDSVSKGDSIACAVKGLANFSGNRATQLYVYRLKRHENLIKIGISFDHEGRAKDPEYGQLELLQEFHCRKDAYFIEQILLQETKSFRYIPGDLMEWPGKSEIRKCNLQTIEDLLVFYTDKLCEMSAQELAMSYLQLSPSERRLIEESQ